MADQAVLRQRRDVLWGEAQVAMAALVAFQQQNFHSFFSQTVTM
jgi:hypothetical protein